MNSQQEKTLAVVARDLRRTGDEDDLALATVILGAVGLRRVDNPAHLLRLADEAAERCRVSMAEMLSDIESRSN